MANDTGLTGDWEMAELFLGKMVNQLPAMTLKMMKREAELLRGTIVQTITSSGGGSWKPLSLWTLAIRRHNSIGGTKPLIASGEMRQSITANVYPSSMSAFVGVNYNAKRKDGGSSVDIAKIQEYGAEYVVKRTKKQVAFLRYIYSQNPVLWGLISSGKNKDGMTKVSIPARPFMEPSGVKWSRDYEGRMKNFLKDYM